MTSKRISSLSCNKEEFDKASVEYQETLKKSGFNEKLEYTENAPNHNRRNRSRKIIWYNPPYDLQVKTNVGKTFLQILGNCFPQTHKLHKILNRNSVKVSYSCMPNIASRISSHNLKTIEKCKKKGQPRSKTCNCRNTSECPLDGNCLLRAVVYQADIKPAVDSKAIYIGLAEPTFKGRWADHKSSMTVAEQKNKTKLSTFVWDKREKGQNCEIKWTVLRKSSPYRSGSNKCNLCLWEKFMIMKGDDTLINKRKEFVSKCLHVDKFLLRNFKIKKKKWLYMVYVCMWIYWFHV